MNSEEFLELAGDFEGTAYVCFEVGNLALAAERFLAIGKLDDDGPICLYERKRDGGPDAYRRRLAVFDGEDEACKAGAFIATMGEMIK